MKGFLGFGISLAAWLMIGSPAAQAQKSADTLRVVWRDALPNVDPYFNNARTGLIVAHQAFDTLLQRCIKALDLLKPHSVLDCHSKLVASYTNKINVTFGIGTASRFVTKYAVPHDFVSRFKSHDR